MCYGRKASPQRQHPLLLRQVHGGASTHGARTTIGLIVHNAAMLMKTPALPKEKRAFGSPPPFHLCQTTQDMVMTYEHVKETETSEMIALKPT